MITVQLKYYIQELEEIQSPKNNEYIYIKQRSGDEIISINDVNNISYDEKYDVPSDMLRSKFGTFSSYVIEMFSAASRFGHRQIKQFYKDLSVYINNSTTRIRLINLMNENQIEKFKMNAQKLSQQRTHRLRKFTQFAIDLFKREEMPLLQRHKFYVNIFNILDENSKYNSSDAHNWRNANRNFIYWGKTSKRPEKGALKPLLTKLLDIIVNKTIARNRRWPKHTVTQFKRNISEIMKPQKSTLQSSAI